MAANPGEVTGIGFGGVTYMQELTPSICRGVTGTNTEGRLIDNRDDKIYYVAKLKDNNCWMTQNLDYDGGGIRRSAASEWVEKNNIAQYWDPGEKIGSGNGAAATDSTDRHTLIGNYYSWQAAVVGTGTESTTSGDYPADASGSICPTNWQLPSSNNTKSGSFGGLTSGISAGSVLVISPYYFQYGGSVNSGGLGNAGNDGYCWSSTASDGNNAYFLYFVSSNVSLSDVNGRYFGLSVRCLVLGS